MTDRRFTSVSGVLSLAVGLIAPVQVVAMDARGIDAATAGVVFGVMVAVSTAAEVPAGIVADRVGYRRVIALGGALMGCGALAFAVAQDRTSFVLAAIAFGLGKALDSGALESLAVEVSRADAPSGAATARTTAVLSRIAFARGAGVATGSIAATAAVVAAGHGGMPASGSPVLLSASVPLLVAGGVLAAYVPWVATRLPDVRPRTAQEHASRPGSLAGVVVVARVPTLRWLALRALLVPFSMAAFHLVTPLQLAQTVGAEHAAVTMGWLLAATFGAQGVGAALAPRIRARWGTYLPSALLTVLAAVSLALVGVAGPLPVVAGLLIACFASTGPVATLLSPVMHACLPSTGRAAALSVVAVLRSVGGLTGAVLLGGVLATGGPVPAYLAGAVAMLLSVTAVSGARRARRGATST